MCASRTRPCEPKSEREPCLSACVRPDKPADLRGAPPRSEVLDPGDPGTEGAHARSEHDGLHSRPEPRRWGCSEPDRYHSRRASLEAYTAFAELGGPSIHGATVATPLPQVSNQWRFGTDAKSRAAGLGCNLCRFLRASQNCPISVSQTKMKRDYDALYHHA